MEDNSKNDHITTKAKQFQKNEKASENSIESKINNQEAQKDNCIVQNQVNVNENKIYMEADNTKNGRKEEKEEEGGGKGENYSNIESLYKSLDSSEIQPESKTITNENNQDEHKNNDKNKKNSKEREPSKQQQNADSEAKEQKQVKKQDFYMDNNYNYKESSSELQKVTKLLENNEYIYNRETGLTGNAKELKTLGKEEDNKLNKKRGRSEGKMILNDSKNKNSSLIKFVTEKKNHKNYKTLNFKNEFNKKEMNQSPVNPQNIGGTPDDQIHEIEINFEVNKNNEKTEDVLDESNT